MRNGKIPGAIIAVEDFRRYEISVVSRNVDRQSGAGDENRTGVLSLGSIRPVNPGVK